MVMMRLVVFVFSNCRLLKLVLLMVMVVLSILVRRVCMLVVIGW